MGGVLSYSGISAKIRAMRTKLISEEQFQEIAQLTSVPQVVAYLKKTPEYEKRWAGIDENTVHRGMVEKLLQKSIFENYTKIYHFASPKQRDFLSLYFKRYEIFLIKECLRTVFDHRNINIDFSVYLDFYEHHSKLDIQKMAACTTVEELIACMKGSEYYVPLAGVASGEDKLVFDYGMALDIYYFRLIWKEKDTLFTGKELEEITRAYGVKFDLLNLQWMERSKLYYKMEPVQIYSLLIPCHYKLKKQEITELVEAEDVAQFRQVLSKTYYGLRYPQQSAGSLEEFYNFLLRSTLKREASRDPYSVIMMYSYLYQKAHEVNRLTTAIECVRYGISPEETMKHIRTA